MLAVMIAFSVEVVYNEMTKGGGIKMSLTKGDIQAIGNIIDERLEKKLESKLEPIQQRLDAMDSRFDAMEEDLAVIRKSQLIVENEYIPMLKATMEGLRGAIEKNYEQDRKIDVLETITEKHDIRICALEYAK